MPSFSLMLRARFKPPPQPDGTPSPLAGVADGKPNGPFGVQPNDRWVTSILSGNSTATKFFLVNREPKPVHVKKVLVGGDTFTVSIQTIEDGKRYELSLATNPGLKPGHYVQTVTLVTDSATFPESKIELEATVHPRVFATPVSIILAPMPVDIDPTSINLPPIAVRKMREAGLKLTSLSSSLPFLKMEVTEELEGQVFRIRLTLDKTKIPGPGAFSGKVRIETNDADSPLIEIPIQGIFK